MALEKVRRLDEAHARDLLAWLESHGPNPGGRQPRGAVAMLGFARRFHTDPRTTSDWIRDLRAGED